MQKINSSLFYRLQENSPRFTDINDLTQDIRNNLEMILNTRSYDLDLPEYLTELRYSLLNYGIADFSKNYSNNKHAQMQLCRGIKEILEIFEPRLRAINVILLDQEVEVDKLLKIRIEGIINIMPSPMPAVFESCLDISKQYFVFAQDYL